MHQSDQVKIIDFGLCKQCKFGELINRKAGYFFGTLGWCHGII